MTESAFERYWNGLASLLGYIDALNLSVGRLDALAMGARAVREGKGTLDKVSGLVRDRARELVESVLATLAEADDDLNITPEERTNLENLVYFRLAASGQAR